MSIFIWEKKKLQFFVNINIGTKRACMIRPPNTLIIRLHCFDLIYYVNIRHFVQIANCQHETKRMLFFSLIFELLGAQNSELLLCVCVWLFHFECAQWTWSSYSLEEVDFYIFFSWKWWWKRKEMDFTNSYIQTVAFALQQHFESTLFIPGIRRSFV